MNTKSVTAATLRRNVVAGKWVLTSGQTLEDALVRRSGLVRIMTKGRGVDACVVGRLLSVIIPLTRAEIDAQSKLEEDAALARINAKR